jgi:hypothetical protein
MKQESNFTVLKPTVIEEGQVQPQASQCGICGGQSGMGTGFSLSTTVFLSLLFHHSINIHSCITYISHIISYIILATDNDINPMNAELNPMYHFLALLGAHPTLHVSRIRFKEHT